jgi:Predicted exporter
MLRRGIIGVYDFFAGRRLGLFLCSILAFALAAFLALQLKLEENILSFLPQDEGNQRVAFVYQNVSLADTWVLRVEAAPGKTLTPQALLPYADSLANYLKTGDKEQKISDIFYRTDALPFDDILSYIVENTPFFLEPSDYLCLDTLLQPSKIGDILRKNHGILLSPAGAFFRDIYARDPLHLSQPVLARLQELNPGAAYPIIDGGLFSQDSSSVIMLVSSCESAEDTGGNAALKALMDKAEAYLAQVSGGEALMSYFGAAAIAVGNAEQIKRDSQLSMLLSLGLILLLFWAFFRALRPMIYLLLPVLFGMTVALGVMALCKGSMSAIALGASSAIVGIALNYSLHFLIHRRMVPDSRQSLEDLVSPMSIGSLTTVGAFLSLLFLSAESLRDFGLLATLVLAATLVFVLFVMPHLGFPTYKLQNRFVQGIEKFTSYTPETQGSVLAIMAACTLVFLCFMPRTGFNGDLSKINYITPKQKTAMEALRGQSEAVEQARYMVSYGADLNAALQAREASQGLVAALRDEGVLSSVQGPGNWLPSQERQQEKARLWKDFWEKKGPEILSVFEAEAAKIGFRPQFHAAFLQRLREGVVGEIPIDHSPLTDRMLADYILRDSSQVMVIDLLYADDYAPEHWEAGLEGQASQFVFDKGSVARSLVYTLTQDFDFVLYICALLVLAFLALAFRSVEMTLLAFIPMVLAWVWILGLMGILGLEFNIVNVILATFIFGLGDDYSIFILEGLSHELSYGKKMLHSYKTAVLLSALTMFIGMGSLIFAQHPAMRSLGEVTVVGMLSVVVISYTVSPALFRWLSRRRGEIRKFPISLASVLRTVVSFLIYLLIVLYLFVVGFVLLRLLGGGKRRKSAFHAQFCGALRFCSKYMFGISFRILNPYKEDFARPAIIIANHQSQLDLLYALAISPKIVAVTNQWVWNSPYYRHIIRYADFVPVYEGLEQSMALLAERMAAGYSVLVFPEGHRAEEGEISRFHQGAFYMARSLNVPILPLVMHGVGHILPKGSIFPNRGAVHVEIGRAYSPDAALSLREQAKEARAWYKEAYAALHAQVACPKDYYYRFRQQYVLRGGEVLGAFRRCWRQHRGFETLMSRLPASGRVLISPSHYGFEALVAACIRRDLQVDAWEADENLRAFAGRIGMNPPNLHILETAPCVEDYAVVIDISLEK